MFYDPTDDMNYYVSGIKKVVDEATEIANTMRDFVQKIQGILRPITEAVAQYQSVFSGAIQTLSKASSILNAIRRLGTAQFVCWEYMSSSFVDEIVSSENINKTLREHFVKEKFRTVNDTIQRCKEYSLMKRHLRVFNQSVEAFQTGNTDLAVIGFTSIIDGLLSDASGSQATSFVKRVSTIMGKLENNEDVDSDEYALLTLMLTFEKAMNLFANHSNFTEKEPKELNRHWIMHGRTRRKKTKLDCIKLINMIQGILLVDEFGKKEINKELL